MGPACVSIGKPRRRPDPPARRLDPRSDPARPAPSPPSAGPRGRACAAAAGRGRRSTQRRAPRPLSRRRSRSRRLRSNRCTSRLCPIESTASMAASIDCRLSQTITPAARRRQQLDQHRHPAHQLDHRAQVRGVAAITVRGRELRSPPGAAASASCCGWSIAEASFSVGKPIMPKWFTHRQPVRLDDGAIRGGTTRRSWQLALR